MHKSKDLIASLRSKIFDAKQLVNYQDDAVVSKTIIDKESGSITLFAFDKGQTVSEHTVPFHALVQILHGKAKVTISQKTLELREGESIIIPPDEPHSLEATEKFKMLLVTIR